MLPAELTRTPEIPAPTTNGLLRTWSIAGSTLLCSRDLVEEPVTAGGGAPCLVVDLDGIEALSTEEVAAIAGAVRSAQRQAMNVYLAGAEQELFDNLATHLDFPVTRHLTHPACAPIPGLNCEGRIAEIRLSAAPDQVQFVRRFIESFCRSASLPPLLVALVSSRLGEAVESAILDGSPEGSRNSILVAVHLKPGRLRVDVSDESASRLAPEGLRTSSSVETAAPLPANRPIRLRDARGCVTRLEWRLPE